MLVFYICRVISYHSHNLYSGSLVGEDSHVFCCIGGVLYLYKLIRWDKKPDPYGLFYLLYLIEHGEEDLILGGKGNIFTLSLLSMSTKRAPAEVFIS